MPNSGVTDNPKNLDVLVKALSATKGAVTIADARRDDMPLIYFNQAFMDLTGYDESEIIDRNCRFLQGKDTDQSAVGEIRSAIANKSDVKVVFKNYKKDGSVFWNDLMMSPVFDKSGMLTHYIGLQLDITLKVEREERERRAREMEMENASLRKEAEMLARLNAAKDDFIAIASHQLRTPATVVKQNLGLLNEGYLGEMPKSQLNAVSTAYDNNDRLIKIINELLRHARVSSDEYSYDTVEIDVVGLLTRIHDVYVQNAASHKRVIVFDIGQLSDIKVQGDVDLLRSAIENLIDNAIAYSYDKSTVRISLSRRGEVVKISVADEGVGIKDKDKIKLFKKFSRINNDHQFNIGGTGLGLYWVKTVIDMHGGKVGVADNQPKGSVFTISLPLHTNTV